MAVRFDPSAEPGVIRLEGAIDIAGAAKLQAVLLEALAGGKAMRIAFAAATGIDVTAVQLLWAARREAEASGAALAVEGPVAETVRATLCEAGCERILFAAEAPGEARE